MTDVYQSVTDRIIAALETAQAWQKPWTSAFSHIGRPLNAVTNRPYTGINVPLLWSTSFASPYWATYRAWASIGAQVQKGMRGTPIVFFKKVTKGSGEDEPETFMLAREYVVFNAEQVTGWNAPALPVRSNSISSKVSTLEGVDRLVSKAGARIQHGGDRACYIPAIDAIRMPDRAAFVGSATFDATAAYYGTLFHELTHWTAEKSRCNRDLSARFGSESYAAEELVAELGAAFLCADHLMQHEPPADHANYLAHWLRVLRNDKRAIFTAASKAEAAVRFINGTSVDETDPAIAA